MSVEQRIRELETRAATLPVPSKGRFDLSRLTTPQLMELRAIRLKLDAGETLTTAEHSRQDELRRLADTQTGELQ